MSKFKKNIDSSILYIMEEFPVEEAHEIMEKMGYTWWHEGGGVEVPNVKRMKKFLLESLLRLKDLAVETKGKGGKFPVSTECGRFIFKCYEEGVMVVNFCPLSVDTFGIDEEYENSENDSEHEDDTDDIEEHCDSHDVYEVKEDDEERDVHNLDCENEQDGSELLGCEKRDDTEEHAAAEKDNLQPHQKRMLEELAQLNERMGKLSAFLEKEGKNSDGKISERQFSLLDTQLLSMIIYANAIKVRMRIEGVPARLYE